MPNYSLVHISSVVHGLSCSQDFCGHHWLTLTFQPVTFSLSSVSCGLTND